VDKVRRPDFWLEEDEETGQAKHRGVLGLIVDFAEGEEGEDEGAFQTQRAAPSALVLTPTALHSPRLFALAHTHTLQKRSLRPTKATRRMTTTMMMMTTVRYIAPRA
jgi:hypothetical protein